MTANGWLQIFLFLLVMFAITKPMGLFMARVFSAREDVSGPVAAAIRATAVSLTGVDEKQEMRWTEYAIAMLLFSGVSMMLLYVIERVQHWLPWNPQNLVGSAGGSGVQHGGFVHHEYELAGLFPRSRR